MWINCGQSARTQRAPLEKRGQCLDLPNEVARSIQRPDSCHTRGLDSTWIKSNKKSTRLAQVGALLSQCQRRPLWWVPCKWTRACSPGKCEAAFSEGIRSRLSVFSMQILAPAQGAIHVESPYCDDHLWATSQSVARTGSVKYHKWEAAAKEKRPVARLNARVTRQPGRNTIEQGDLSRNANWREQWVAPRHQPILRLIILVIHFHQKSIRGPPKFTKCPIALWYDGIKEWQRKWSTSLLIPLTHTWFAEGTEL